jgi:hypothetical protein
MSDDQLIESINNPNELGGSVVLGDGEVINGTTASRRLSGE